MSWRRHYFGVAACLALAACGFQLRGAANYAFDSIYVGAPPALPFTVELKRALAGAGSAKVVDVATGAQVVLDISNISDDKSVLSLSPGGRAREFLLVKRVSFSLRDNAGNIWLPLENGWTRSTFGSHMRNAGIGVVASDAFAVEGPAPEAVRVCLGGPITREKLKGALDFMGHALEGPPEMAASFF